MIFEAYYNYYAIYYPKMESYIYQRYQMWRLGETVEKLTILHIRTWMLEDAIQAATSDQEIADLKRKIDICFKIKRPKYVAAINAMVDSAVSSGRTLREDSVKLYKGLDNE